MKSILKSMMKIKPKVTGQFCIKNVGETQFPFIPSFVSLFLRFIFITFYWKGGYTERRDREEDLPSDDSLPK